jgi:hypothetical protein
MPFGGQKPSRPKQWIGEVEKWLLVAQWQQVQRLKIKQLPEFV